MPLRATRRPTTKPSPRQGRPPRTARLWRLLAIGTALTIGAAGTRAMAAPDGGAATPPTNAPTSADAMRRGVVQVEASGRPIAIGIVLGNDGRVLTSASALRDAKAPELRYADGTVVQTRVGHVDRGWDLALLVPLSGKWRDGLTPSSTSTADAGATVKSYLPKGGKLAAVTLTLKGGADARSADGELLQGALAIDFKGLPSVLGAPLLDPEGKVLGALVRACKSTGGPNEKPSGTAPKPCTATTVAAPIHAIRSFLVKTPKTAALPAPWLGLGVASVTSGNIHGVRVMGIAPGSPAERAGLTAGANADTIVAVDGKPIETPEQLAEVIGERAIGDTVKLLVLRGGKFREATVKLEAAPPEKRDEKRDEKREEET